MKAMNKFIVSSFLAVGLVAALGPFAYAANEPARPDGSCGVTAIAEVRHSTDSDSPSEVRRLQSRDDGRLKTSFTTSRSSWVDVAHTSNVLVINGLPQSTATIYTSSFGVTYSPPSPMLPNVSTVTPVDNQHVFAICSSSQPCGPLTVISGNGAPNIRIFDSRGSTSTGKVWEGTLASTGTAMGFTHDFSSGIVVMQKGGSAWFGWNPGKPRDSGGTR